METVGKLNLAEKQMFPLKVISLFTNLLTIKTVEQFREVSLKKNIDLDVPVDERKQFLFTCTQNVQFKFDRTIYRQKDGIV